MLFLEEITSELEFANIFLSKIHLADANIVEIRHSETDTESGESDMTIIVSHAGKKHALLIEDKIDAVAMDRQCERYFERGYKGKERGDYDDFSVFIVAPKKYLETNFEAAKYPQKVSYEECAEYFLNKPDSRSWFKYCQICQAIEKQKHGYQTVENTAVTAFWKEYIDYQEHYFPSLEMSGKNNSKGARAIWPHFKTSIDKLYIQHKSEKGYVDLTFTGKAEEEKQLLHILSSCVSDFSKRRIIVDVAGKSSVLRKRVPKIDFKDSFSGYTSAVHESLQAVEELSTIVKELSTNQAFIDFLKQ